MYVRLEGRCEIVWVLLVFHILLNLFKFIYFLVSLRKYILISFMNWQNGLFTIPFLLLFKDLLRLFDRFSLLCLLIYELLIFLYCLKLAMLDR